jgi:hypothetical protein
MIANYHNQETKVQGGGKKIVRKVSIKNNKGYKCVTHYYKGKRIGATKKHLRSDEIHLIKNGKFIPGLFSDCKCNKMNKTKKYRKI